jgi:hypothetical protein
VNFTREPIVETIITPKDGYKIVLRNSKLQTEEEYSVEAVEIVSFGSAIFYRSLERPKPFLLPTTDYEVYESKEVRMVLKTEPVEKNIKIGGGKKPVLAPPPMPPQEDAQSRKRRTRRRRTPEDVETDVKVQQPPKEAALLTTPPPPVRQLLPPPSSLISDHLSRYKNYQIADRAPVVVSDEKMMHEIAEESAPIEEEEEETSTDISFLIDDELLKRD